MYAATWRRLLPRVMRSATGVLLSAAVLALCTGDARADEIADAARRAVQRASAQLRRVKLNSVYATEAFAPTGRLVAPAYLNLTGELPSGRPMLISYTLQPDGQLRSTESDTVRADEYGHHLTPPLELDRWYTAEEAVSTALAWHPRFRPAGQVSVHIRNSREHGDTPVIIVYWISGTTIPHVMFGATSGKVLDIGTTPRSAVHQIEFRPGGSSGSTPSR